MTELLVQGLRNAEIAKRLVVTPKTVDHHVSAILRKLNVETRGQAVAAITTGGLLDRARTEGARTGAAAVGPNA